MKVTPRLSATFGLVAVLSGLAWSRGGLAAVPSVVQRIQHVEDDILPSILVTGEPRQKIKLIDRMAELNVPGLSIAVIHNGRIDWARGYGVTSAGGPRVTPDTLFQAASISKTITALAALHAVQAGELNLDRDVNQSLKGWKVPANGFTDQTKVTLRELLNHTAGMTVHGFPGYGPNELLPTTVQILNGIPPANTPPIHVDVVPGTHWQYSGGGYVVVQQLLEDVTGQPFSKFVRDVVLTPLQMNHSTFEQPLPERLLANAAMPFDASGKPLPGGAHSYPEKAPAGLWTTSSDLARYAIEVQQSFSGTSTRVLSQNMTRQMLAPGMNSWGLGLSIGGSAPHQYFTHTGANEGYRCALVAFEEGDGAVLMTNSDNGNMLIDEVIGTLAHEYGWTDLQPTVHSIAKIDPLRFDVLSGSYQIDPGFILTFTREGDRFFSQAIHQGKIEIYPESEHRYFAKAVGAQVTFETDPEGRVTKLIVRQGNIDREGQRLDNAAAKAVADEMAVEHARP
jgi:CubicO group peptidase (beta-lactamase class C family)